jgi:hypothetical protein
MRVDLRSGVDERRRDPDEVPVDKCIAEAMDARGYFTYPSEVVTH